MEYILKHFDTSLFRFTANANSAEPEYQITWINEAGRELLPKDMDTITEAEIDRWIRHRTIPKNRAFVHDLLAKCGLNINRPMSIVAVCKGLSLNDCYDACGREKFTMYEQYREGKITADEYLIGKDELAKKQAALKEQLDECEAQYEANHQKSLAAAEQQQTASRMTGLSDDKLREHLYDAVERILVHDAESIEIIWKFDDGETVRDEGESFAVRCDGDADGFL